MTTTRPKGTTTTTRKGGLGLVPGFGFDLSGPAPTSPPTTPTKKSASAKAATASKASDKKKAKPEKADQKKSSTKSADAPLIWPRPGSGFVDPGFLVPAAPRGEEQPVPLPYTSSPKDIKPGVIANLKDGEEGSRISPTWMVLGLTPITLLLLAKLLMAYWNRRENFDL